MTKFHFYSYDKLADEDDDETTTTTTKSTSLQADNDVKVTTEWTRSLNVDELNTVGELFTTGSSSERKPAKRQRLTATGRSISGSNLAPPVESGGVTTDSSDETIESTSDEEEENENHSTQQTTNEPFKETAEWARDLSTEESQAIQTTLTGEDETTAEIASTQSEFTTNNDYSTHQDASTQETIQQQDATTADSSTQEAIQQHDTTVESSTHEATTLSNHKDDDDNDEDEDDDKEKIIITPSTSDHNQEEQTTHISTVQEEVTTIASPSKDHEISLEFTYRRERNIISLNCTETNGILLENIEIRKNNGRVIASIESSSNLQIKVRKWQLNDDETLYCLVHDGYTFKEQSLHIDI